MNPHAESMTETVRARIDQEREQWGAKEEYPEPGTQDKTPDAGSLSVFPKEAVQGLAREFSDTFTEYLESPFEFWTFSCLTCLGNLLADRITLDSTLNIQPRLFTILLGQSADERKSECIKQTTGEFWETFQDRFSPCWGVGSAEGLGARLEKNPKTLLTFDELKTFVSKSMIDGAILLPAVNTLFELNRFHSNTKSHSIEINNGFLSLLAASTVDTYSRMWTAVFMDIGFLNRLWLVPARAEKKFAIPENLPQRKRDRLRERLREVISRHCNLTVFRVSQEARSIFGEWYADRTKSPLFGKRLDTYGHRLMTLFAANEGASEITGDIAGRVVSLLRWQEQVRRALDPIDAESNTARMEESIRRILTSGAIKERDLKNLVNYRRHGLHVWKMGIQNLLSAGEVVFDVKRKLYFLKRGK